MEMSKEKRKEFNKKLWWGPVESKELAEFMVKEVAKGFYVVAVIQAVVGLILFWPGLIVEAVIMAAVAYWLQKSKSKIPAIILLVLSALAVIGTAMSISGSAIGGTNIFLAVLLLWFSIRAFQATSKLGESSSPSTPNE